MQEHQNLITPLCNLTVQAGQHIMKYWRTPLNIIQKADESPKTHIDDDAENIIIETLTKLSSIPIVAEEKFASTRTPKAGSSNDFWLIDALDGTRQFITGFSDFSVNIALIINNQPVLGIIHAPVTGDTWYASKNHGTFHVKDGQTNQIFMRTPNRDALTILGGRMSSAPETLTPFIGEHSIQERGTRSSSLKFCALAEGRWDVYPRLGNTYEWDTAAGDIILREAGGSIIDIRTHQPLAYNKTAPDYLNTGFIAAHAALFKTPSASSL